MLKSVKLSWLLPVAAIALPLPATVASAAPMELRYSDIGPPRGPRAAALEWWAQELDKRSNGQIKIKFFWSQSLVKGKETLKAVGSGLAEMGTIIGIYTPAELPVWNVANMPFFFSDAWVGMRTMWEARKVIPELNQETEKLGVKILFNNTTGPVQLLSTKVPMRTVADLKGKKIRTTGGWTQLFEGLGAVPVNIGFGELYAALDRGTIDATINYTPFVKSYKHYEVASHLTEANMGQVLGYGCGINLAFWNKLPKDLQDILAKTSDEYMDDYARKSIEDSDASKAELTAGIDGRKVAFHQLSKDERAKWQEAAKPFLDKWLADMKKRGHDGPAILAKIKSIQAKYRQELDEKGYPWKR